VTAQENKMSLTLWALQSQSLKLPSCIALQWKAADKNQNKANQPNDELNTKTNITKPPNAR
jgi:hypothetical protein